MLRVMDQWQRSSKVSALRFNIQSGPDLLGITLSPEHPGKSGEANMQEVQTLVEPQRISKVRSFWESNVKESDPDLVPPDLVTPRFSDKMNFPRFKKLTVFDPDLVPTPI
eukprot:sb/3477249/